MQHTDDGHTRGTRVQKSQKYMIVAIVSILIVTVLLFLYMQHVAGQSAAKHKHSFMEYVTTNHLGALMTIDSGTGLEPMSYIMTLNHPLADNAKESFVMDMSHRYYEYDHGQALTIVYVNPKTHQQYPIAEAHYDRVVKKLAVNITEQSGQTLQFVKQVNW